MMLLRIMIMDYGFKIQDCKWLIQDDYSWYKMMDSRYRFNDFDIDHFWNWFYKWIMDCGFRMMDLGFDLEWLVEALEEFRWDSSTLAIFYGINNLVFGFEAVLVIQLVYYSHIFGFWIWGSTKDSTGLLLTIFYGYRVQMSFDTFIYQPNYQEFFYVSIF